MRTFINIVEATFYRGSRLDPNKTRRSTMSFTDDPDIASVYASDPATGAFTTGSRVSRADFDFQNPVDLSHDLQIDLNTALGEAGLSDVTQDVQSVLNLIYALGQMDDRGIPFHYRIARDLSWDELLQAVRRSAAREDWDRFFDYLDYTVVDSYAICDTKTFARIAIAHGHDGIIHMDSFDRGKKVAASLLGLDKADTHLTYRPFGEVTWR